MLNRRKALHPALGGACLVVLAACGAEPIAPTAPPPPAPSPAEGVITVLVQPFDKTTYCTPPDTCAPQLPDAIILDGVTTWSFSAWGEHDFTGLADGGHGLSIQRGSYGSPVICGFVFGPGTGTFDPSRQAAIVVVTKGSHERMTISYSCHRDNGHSDY